MKLKYKIENIIEKGKGERERDLPDLRRPSQPSRSPPMRAQVPP
jgi:hypothetical protein